MSAVAFASGTQTCVINTEHFFSSPNVPGEFAVVFDRNLSAANDVFLVQVYQIVLTGGTVRRVACWGWSGAMSELPIDNLLRWFANDLSETNALRFSITQTEGTGRDIPWKVLRLTDQVDVTKWNGTAVATPDTAGYPKVTIKSGTGAGELNISSGVVDADVREILGSSGLATLWSKMVDAGEYGLAITGTLSTTQTSTDLTEVTDDAWVGRLLVMTSGPNIGLYREITDYVGSTKVFTHAAFPAANQNNNSFVIL